MTDAIDKLREAHVSKNPDSTYAKKPNLIYSNITRMIDKALFDIQVSSKAKRNLMTKSQLSVLDIAELGIAKKIYESNYRKYKEKLTLECGFLRIDYNIMKTDMPLDFALFQYLSARSNLK